MAAPKRPQLNRMGSKGTARKAPMSRTSGTARRELGASEAIKFKMKAGMPLTGSASGAKSITTRQAGETLTQGIVTLNKKNKLQVDPVGLAMALPLGKVAKAGKVIRAAAEAGDAAKFTRAIALEQRVGAKVAGREFGKALAERKAAKGGPIFESILGAGRTRRAASEKVFVRGGNKGVGTSVNEYVARAARKSNLPMAEKRIASEATKNSYTRFTGFSRDLSRKAAGKPSAGELYRARLAKLGSEGMRVRELEKRLSLPAAGSVEMVKKTAKQFGQKVSGKEAKMISRLLRGRDR